MVIHRLSNLVSQCFFQRIVQFWQLPPVEWLVIVLNASTHHVNEFHEQVLDLIFVCATCVYWQPRRWTCFRWRTFFLYWNVSSKFNRAESSLPWHHLTALPFEILATSRVRLQLGTIWCRLQVLLIMDTFACARPAKIDHSIFLIKVNHVGTAITRSVLTKFACLGKNGTRCRLSSATCAIVVFYDGFLLADAEDISFWATEMSLFERGTILVLRGWWINQDVRIRIWHGIVWVDLWSIFSFQSMMQIVLDKSI